MKEGDVLDRRFRLEARAGAGATGVVFRAVDLSRGSLVAVKVLKQHDAIDVARFDREAEVLAALQHPSVVRYVAHGRTPANEPFLVMEWLAGETLKDRLARGPLSTLESVDVALALAAALAGAHARGVVHRDVKPANVFLVGGSTRSVKLLDFGVAALRRRSALTEVGALVGTPAYMSPEQARAEEVDARSDVFSLGALLFHCVASRRPFEGGDLLDMVLRIARERAPSVTPLAPGAPLELAQAIDAMLDPDPARRPALAAVAAAFGRLRASAAPSHTASHVVPIAPRVTLLQQAPPAPSDVAATSTRSLAVSEVVVAPPRARSSAALPIAIVGGVIAIAAAVGVGVLLTRSGDEKRRRARHAATSASVVATVPLRAASVDATRRIGELSPPPPPPPPSPPPGTLPGCDRTDLYEMCAPIPDDILTGDPNAFLKFCTAVARRSEPTAALTEASFTTMDGHVALQSVQSVAMCQFRTRAGRRFMLSKASNLLQRLRSAAHSDPQIRAEISMPEELCPFEKIWATAKPIMAPVEGMAILSGTDGHPAWLLMDGGRTVTRFDALTCALQFRN